MFLARVYVTLKPTVNDPQGLTIRGGLHSLGFDSVESVRAGKYLEIRLDGSELIATATLPKEVTCTTLDRFANPNGGLLQTARTLSPETTRHCPGRRCCSSVRSTSLR